MCLGADTNRGEWLPSTASSSSTLSSTIGNDGNMNTSSIEGGKKRGRAAPLSNEQLSSSLADGWSITRWRVPHGTPLYHVHVYWPDIENRLLTISDDQPPFPPCSSDSFITTTIPAAHQLYQYRHYKTPVIPSRGVPYMPGDYVEFWLDVNGAHNAGRQIAAETKLPTPAAHAAHAFGSTSTATTSTSKDTSDTGVTRVCEWQLTEPVQVLVLVPPTGSDAKTLSFPDISTMVRVLGDCDDDNVVGWLVDEPLPTPSVASSSRNRVRDRRRLVLCMVNDGRERVVATSEISVGVAFAANGTEVKSSPSLLDDDTSVDTNGASMTRITGIGGVRRCLKLIDDDRKPAVQQRLITDMFAALSLGDKGKDKDIKGDTRETKAPS